MTDITLNFSNLRNDLRSGETAIQERMRILRELTSQLQILEQNYQGAEAERRRQELNRATEDTTRLLNQLIEEQRQIEEWLQRMERLMHGTA